VRQWQQPASSRAHWAHAVGYIGAHVELGAAFKDVTEACGMVGGVMPIVVDRHGTLCFLHTHCCCRCCRCCLMLLQAEIGVDAGAYARLLMVHAKEAADAAADAVAQGTLSAQAILESAFYRTNVQGVCAMHHAASRMSSSCSCIREATLHPLDCTGVGLGAGCCPQPLSGSAFGCAGSACASVARIAKHMVGTLHLLNLLVYCCCVCQVRPLRVCWW
jgi:hypothetical protein